MAINDRSSYKAVVLEYRFYCTCKNFDSFRKVYVMTICVKFCFAGNCVPASRLNCNLHIAGFADFSSASDGGGVSSGGEAGFAAFLKASNSTSVKPPGQAAPQSDRFAGKTLTVAFYCG